MASLFVLASYCKFPKLREFAFTLVVWLAIADIGTDLAYFLGDRESGSALCTLQVCVHPSLSFWVYA